MRRTTLFLSVVGTALVPVACGGAAPQQPAQGPAQVASAPPAVAVATGPSLGDLSAVPEPPDVVAVARWRSPATTFSTIHSWFGIPVPIDELAREMFRQPGASSVIATEAPVDLLVALDPAATDRNPQPFVGFSIGVRSVGEARQLFEQKRPMREVHPGVFHLELGRHRDLSCLLAPSVGMASGRVVCGPRERDVEALYPYMTRGLPAVPPPAADMWGEIRLGPVLRVHGANLPGYLKTGAVFASHELGTGNPRLDRAMTDGLTGLADEAGALAGDLEGASFEVTMSGAARAADASFSLRLRGRRSWTAQRLVEQAPQAGTPPPIFWRAPKSSDMAFYGRSHDPKAYEGIRRVGAELIEGALAEGAFPAADRKAVVSLFDRLFQTGPVTVSAAGHADAAPVAAGGGDPELERIRASIVSTIGWHLWGLEEPPARALGWLRDLGAAYNRPAVKEWIRAKTKADAKVLPAVKLAPFGGKGLDKGTQALEITLSGAAFDVGGGHGKARPPASLTCWLVVMPDGNRTWVALGADRASLERHLATVRTGGPDAQTLAARPGLEALKSGRAMSAGFMTLAALAAQSGGGIASALRSRRGYFRHSGIGTEWLARVPNHGETPILVVSTARDASASELTVKLQMTSGTVDDIRAAVSAFVPMLVPPPPPPGPPPHPPSP